MTNTPADYLPELLARLRQVTPERADALLEAAALDHPRDPRPLLLLAARLVEARQVDRAEGMYTLALQRDPGFAPARFQLGLLQLTNGRVVAAGATWAPLEELDAREPLRLFANGMRALVEDRFADARALLVAGIAENQTNAPLNRDMRLVLERIAHLGGTPAAAPEPDAPDASRPGAPQAPGHFLASLYGRQR